MEIIKKKTGVSTASRKVDIQFCKKASQFFVSLHSLDFSMGWNTHS